MNSRPRIVSPEEIPALFAEAWNERDADKIAALFDEDADFVNVVGIWWSNREDIRKAHHYGLRVIFNNSDLKVTKTRLKYLSDSIATVHAKPGMRFNIFTFVVHITENGWSDKDQVEIPVRFHSHGSRPDEAERPDTKRRFKTRYEVLYLHICSSYN
jgi:hypothetical protein